jgi:transposase
MIDEIDQTYLNGLSHPQKDALILMLCAHIKALTARLEVVEAELAELKKDNPKKTSKNSSLPPSTDFKANIEEDGSRHIEDSFETGKVKKKRKGVGRKLDPNPDERVSFSCEFCPSCHSVLGAQD